MNYALSPISVIPIKVSPLDKSEMVSQLLFGEMVEILLTKGKRWTKIRCLYDNIVGWVYSNQLTLLTPSEKELYQENFAFSLELMHPVMDAEYSRPICIGAKLPNFDGIRFSLAEKYFTFSGQAIFPNDLKPTTEVVLKFARKYMFAPYAAGGRSPLGIDSAALIQLVFSFVGIQLPRFASYQVEQGVTVDFVQQAQAGDIAFFENKAGNITHVGLLLQDKYIIHCSGHVRIDKVDHFGIYNEQLKKYTHKLRIVKRLLDTENIVPLKEVEQQVVSENQIDLF